jgi:NADH-quinone oxidoreductase subunit M
MGAEQGGFVAVPGAVSSYSGAFPFLTVLVLVPAGTAVAVALVPRAMAGTVRAVALAGSLATTALAVVVAVRFSTGVAGYQMVSRHPWVQVFGISWNLGIDGISLFLVLLCALLFPLTLLGAGVRRDPKTFAAWVLVLETACLGCFLSLDLLLFFVFFELTLVPVYFIIGGWGHERRGYAAVKFFLYTFLGSAFLFVGILAVVFIHQSQTGVLTFDLTRLANTHFSSVTGLLLFLAFTAAFAVKAPVFPVHTWSPTAYREAPAAGSILLAAVMAKIGTYGIIRFDLELFPKASVDLAPLLLTLGVIGIVYGAIVAAAQRDLKRLVAYSSLAHLGFIVLGTFALTSQGLSGGVLQMVNHGLYTAGLFLLIGMMYERSRTWQTDQFGGLQRSAPVMAAVFTLVMLASIGLPGLNGFVGEFLILVGTFVTHRWWAVVAAAGVILAAVYLLWAYQQVFHGRTGERSSRFRDLSWREGAIMAPLVVLIVIIGIYPRPVLDRINPSVTRLVDHVQVANGSQQPKVAAGDHR